MFVGCSWGMRIGLDVRGMFVGYEDRSRCSRGHFPYIGYYLCKKTLYKRLFV